jgi:hypothetical protein
LAQPSRDLTSRCSSERCSHPTTSLAPTMSKIASCASKYPILGYTERGYRVTIELLLGRLSGTKRFDDQSFTISPLSPVPGPSQIGTARSSTHARGGWTAAQKTAVLYLEVRVRRAAGRYRGVGAIRGAIRQAVLLLPPGEIGLTAP